MIFREFSILASRFSISDPEGLALRRRNTEVERDRGRIEVGAFFTDARDWRMGRVGTRGPRVRV